MKVYNLNNWHYWYNPSLRLWAAEHIGLENSIMYESSKPDILDAIKKQGEDL